ncbi:MAG: ATP synthase delta/epsilon chain alpha-helix domain-containing protein [Clostridium sp.]
MGNTFTLKIITPDKEIFNGEVISFNTETLNGRYEFLAHHASSIITTKPTISSYKVSEGVIERLFTSTGIVKVKNNVVILCCDAAERPEEIDLSRAEAAKERAEARLHEPSKNDVDRAKVALARAMTRLDIKSYNH